MSRHKDMVIDMMNEEMQKDKSLSAFLRQRAWENQEPGPDEFPAFTDAEGNVLEWVKTDDL